MFPFPTTENCPTRGAPVAALFVSKLYEIFTGAESSSYVELTHDNVLVIKDIETFGNTILPKYLKTWSYRRFEKHMQLYDFHVVEVPEGLKQVRYSHKFFQRGRPDLLSNIKRQVKLDSKVSGDRSDDNTEDTQQSSPVPNVPTSPKRSLSHQEIERKGAKVGQKAEENSSTQDASLSSNKPSPAILSTASTSGRPASHDEDRIRLLKRQLLTMGERIQKKFEEHDSEIRELKRVVRGLQEALLRKGGGEGADDDASNTRGTPREDKEDKRSEPETKNKVILSTSTAALLETFASLASAQPAMTSSPSSASATSSAAALLSAPLQKLEAKQPAKEVETGGKATMDIGMTSFPSGHRNFELNPSNLPHWLDRNQASHAPTVSKKQSFNSLHSLKVKYTSNGLHNPPLSHLSHPSGGGSGAQPSAATSGVKRPATTSPPHEEAESGAGGSSSADDGRIHAGGSSKTIRKQLSKDEALIDAI